MISIQTRIKKNVHAKSKFFKNETMENPSVELRTLYFLESVKSTQPLTLKKEETTSNWRNNNKIENVYLSWKCLFLWNAETERLENST